MSVVTQARKYGEAGWGPVAIVKLLAEDGVTVSLRSVVRWNNPAIAERDRLRELRRRRRDASRRSGKLGLHITNVTDEFKFTRVCALSRAGLSCNAVAKVMRLDFGDALTETQVRWALESGRYPRVRAEASA